MIHADVNDCYHNKNLAPLRSATGRMENWNDGIIEIRRRNFGMMEYWKDERIDLCKAEA
jgi:hypothetical protein